MPPLLVTMWFAWFAPIFGTPSNVTPLEWHLRHLAVMTVIISLIAGYIDLGRFLPAIVGKQIAGRRSSSAATWMWIITYYGVALRHAAIPRLIIICACPFGISFQIFRRYSVGHAFS